MACALYCLCPQITTVYLQSFIIILNKIYPVGGLFWKQRDVQFYLKSTTRLKKLWKREYLEIYEVPSEFSKFQYEYPPVFLCILSPHSLIHTASVEMVASWFVCLVWFLMVIYFVCSSREKVLNIFTTVSSL